MLLVAFLVTISVGIKEGIGFSVVMSLVAMIYRSTKPHFAVLGQLEDARLYRNIERFDNLFVD